MQLRLLGTMVQMATDKHVPPQLIINWDQTTETRLNVVPSSLWTMEQKGKASKQDEIAGLKLQKVDHCHMTGDILPC